jgi:hypothetical protein
LDLCQIVVPLLIPYYRLRDRLVENKQLHNFIYRLYEKENNFSTISVSVNGLLK